MLSTALHLSVMLSPSRFPPLATTAQAHAQAEAREFSTPVCALTEPNPQHHASCYASYHMFYSVSSYQRHLIQRLLRSGPTPLGSAIALRAKSGSASIEDLFHERQNGKKFNSYLHSSLLHVRQKAKKGQSYGPDNVWHPVLSDPLSSIPLISAYRQSYVETYSEDDCHARSG